MLAFAKASATFTIWRTSVSRYLATLALTLCCALPVGATAEGFKIRSASAELKDGVYHLDAVIDIQFSDASLEALNSGVAIPVRIDMEVVRDRRWWLAETVAELRADYELQRHALSEQYIVRNVNLGTSRGYGSLKVAKAALGTITDFPLIDALLVSEPGSYRVGIRARLNIEALPAPLRPLAYISSLWRLDSDWYRWPIHP
ncbi:MAG: DUF4390 domain-containing protein [Gammaproteobacteria bacterium]|nr:DUF4390 domain-containing protein [Gammaproteobacteria bacterium]